MVAEVTGQPLSSITEFDTVRWAVHWQDEPPMLRQCRDILAQIAAMVGQGLGAKDLSATDFLPEQTKKKVEAKAVSDEVMAYFNKIGAEITRQARLGKTKVVDRGVYKLSFF